VVLISEETDGNAEELGASKSSVVVIKGRIGDANTLASPTAEGLRKNIPRLTFGMIAGEERGEVGGVFSSSESGPEEDSDSEADSGANAWGARPVS
jgi:hypothetical protein